MGQVIIQRNPLNAALNETAEHEGPLIDWVVERFPAGFPAKTLLVFNGAHLEIRDMDRVVGPEDEVYVLIEPGWPAAVAYLGSAAFAALATQAVAGAVISYGLSLAANWLRGDPDTSPGQGERETPSPTYSLTIPTNRARLGEVMPVVYGVAKVVPDIASEPYRHYVNNLPFPEYLFVTVGIGRGVHEFNREDIFVGDSSIGSIANPMLNATIIDYKSFPPTRHNNSWGRLQTQCADANSDGLGGDDGQPNVGWDTPKFYEDVETSVEVANQELRHAVTVGNYVANRAGSVTREIQIDIEFPQGLYAPNPSVPGGIIGQRVDFSAYLREIDEDGNDLGGSTMTFNFFVVLGTTSPVRQTFTIPGGAGPIAYGRYRVSLRRSTVDSATTDVIDRSYWTGLRAVLSHVDQAGNPVPGYSDVYAHMHLVVFRIKATEGIARDAANRISINATRIPASTNYVFTNNPALIVEDMMTSQVYGAGRSVDELDMVRLDELRLKWDSNVDGFNAVYTSSTSLWSAMQQALRIADATPVIYGGAVTVSEDIAKEYQYYFTPGNIVDGSVSTTYTFNDTSDYDCYEVEYLAPGSFIPGYVRYPSYGEIPLQVRFFGCTNEALAAHQAEFLWFKRTFRRKYVSFKTEAVGNIPLVGDRISVEHPVVVKSGSEAYIVESISPEDQFSVTIQGIIDNFIYSPIPGSASAEPEALA